MIRGLLLGAAVSVALVDCMVIHRLTGPKLYGTCAGACDHYVACKPDHVEADNIRCRRECPDVFSDRDNLMTFESLSCEDAVEYVDGRPGQRAAATTADTSPGSPAPRR